MLFLLKINEKKIKRKQDKTSPFFYTLSACPKGLFMSYGSKFYLSHFFTSESFYKTESREARRQAMMMGGQMFLRNPLEI